MKKCSRCGKKYDEEEAEEIFEMRTSKEWGCIQISLCADCAVEAIENEDGQVYRETCDRCGKTYDPWEARAEFSCQHEDDAGADIDMFDQILCVDCANELYENHLSEYYPSEDEI